MTHVYYCIGFFFVLDFLVHPTRSKLHWDISFHSGMWALLMSNALQDSSKLISRNSSENSSELKAGLYNNCYIITNKVIYNISNIQ